VVLLLFGVNRGAGTCFRVCFIVFVFPLADLRAAVRSGDLSILNEAVTYQVAEKAVTPSFRYILFYLICYFIKQHFAHSIDKGGKEKEGSVLPYVFSVIPRLDRGIQPFDL
jgi:hypothetical protein